ncbi:MAG TPA: hypothetical protein VGM36_16300 [Rhizomicrobium sp.]|jgi:hypothetical protein
MSELITSRANSQIVRWQLLTTVCVLALAGVVTGEAKAEGNDRPTVWIELGAQLERVDGNQQTFLPSFSDAITGAGFSSPAAAQKPPGYAIGGEGKIEFAPEGSDWVFSGGVRYGRSNGSKELRQSVKIAAPAVFAPGSRTGQRYADTQSSYSENHAIVDFQVGKDVGLGMFGHEGRSVWSLGVRFAQFGSSGKVGINANPDFAFSFLTLPGYGAIPIGHHNHAYRGQSQSDRSFIGLGPSVAWDASATLSGSRNDSALTLDWGVNAAVLFGRKKAGVHNTDGGYSLSEPAFGYYLSSALPSQGGDHSRSRSAIVPNLGGFAGLSMKFPNAKVSLGYRADYFFGAMDEGMATRSSGDRSFHGPFATISIGLGG